MKNIIVVIFQVFFLTTCFGQAVTDNTLMNSKQSRTENINLHGPVKSAYWYYTYISDSLGNVPDLQKAKEDVMYFNRNIGGELFTAFDNNGRLIKQIPRYENWMDMTKKPLSERYAIFHEYDDKDLQQKKNIKVTKYPKYPICIDYQIVKLNFVYKNNIYQNDHKEVFGYVYLLDKNKRIREEKFYLVSDSDKFILNEKDLITKTEFVYNNNGNLIKQNIKPGISGKEMPFTALDTESSYCPDLHFSYEYDNQDRIVKMTLYGCEEVVQSETYTYDSNKNYISKNEIYFTSSLRSKVYITKKTIMYYDEFGNIIHKQYIPDFPNQKLRGFMYELPQHTYYKYEYDKYNNWYKCNIYMNGEDGPITATIERELQYYDS
ncbi:hypothetical protein [Chryseobacterium polytrichastri]|uniref:YD repeat-containing protein n=1 Tax=Chryseobacterium polytrichastri TaxID=1302687 RepID=A0A1M6UYN3_9FLAO|nr:hypothetical protein [Chryseobacterium polytrichastri]SHK74362.1 hypothetical protein SAMN05444267_100788 [Chryseobacterium polytrichastri]